jgi:hypothetical protein
MWAITHLLTGMALGSVLPGGLPAVIPAALAGHLLLDLVPHWDYTRQKHKYVWGAIDVGVTAVVTLVGWLYLHLPADVLWCGVVSVAPDLDLLNDLLPWPRRMRWFPSHRPGFPHGHAGPLPGVAVQAVLAAVSIAVVMRFG